MRHDYKIGEIAQLYSIGTDSLRYYEEAGLLSPRRDENGYRLYSIDDIWRLNVIRDMLRLDFSTARIKEYLDTRTVEGTLSLLLEERAVIDARISELENIKNKLTEREAGILNALRRPAGEISVRTLPARACVRLDGEPLNDAEVDFAVKKLHKQYEDELFLIHGGTVGAILDDASLKSGAFDRFSRVFIITPHVERANFTLPAGDYVTAAYSGPSKNRGMLLPRMEAYAAQNGRKPNGSAIELFLIDIHESADELESLTELQIPLAPV
ncbi:MAG: MerR family transcriptional regulator [Eubacteriales bacterium]|nr:MerR family transcriptional regulator [Eubacteriales bacterium]